MWPSYWRVLSYLVCSYLIVAAVYLGLAAHLPAAGTGVRTRRRLTVPFRAVIGLLIIMAALVIMAIMRLDSRSVLLVPGRVILVTFYTNSAYASPLPIIVICMAIIVTVIRMFRRTNGSGSRTRAFAVFLLILLPLVPYGVVEGQTLLFGRYFADYLRHEASVDGEKCKVLSLGPNSATIGVEDFARNLYYLKKVNGEWRIEDSLGIKGEYIGVFPPYPRLDW